MNRQPEGETRPDQQTAGMVFCDATPHVGDFH